MMKQNYSHALAQSDVIHELVHYLQYKKGQLGECPANFEIPAYLTQIYYYKKKTGNGATADMIEKYKRDYCNTLY